MSNTNYNFEQLKQQLHENFTRGKSPEDVAYAEKRFTHTLGVVETAEKLAKMYGADVEKARVAALLHDCAKFYKYEDFARKHDIKLDYDILKHLKVIHSFLGVFVAKIEYGIEDEEILGAIKYHTTGKPDMTVLEKIVYLADAIEPGREEYGYLEEGRKLACEDLDKAVGFILERTIKYVEERKLKLCYLTKEAYEWYSKK
ncbi:MAG TPA: hypothetical protein DCP90_05255 [Clostridiales bacterium]|nr:MAG: hypothetical protein A2Y22_08950 [Clostridiales bacterium GWD2_32_59]HAN10007.1 hypothetical protein [Clostridiales bacterium]